MAFYSGYPSYSFPTTFAQQAPIQASASQHEGSQAGDIAQSQSVSGFAAQPIVDAGFGYPYGAPIATGATYIGGAAPFYGAQHTVLPGATVIPGGYPVQQTVLGGALVPVAAPQVRRPGYNERLVAWRNRQKAFNRYKRQTKEAIKNANSAHYHHQNTLLAHSTVLAPQATYFGGAAAPIYGAAPYGQSTFIGGGYPYGTTFLPSAYPGFLPAGAVYGAEHVEQQGDYNNGEFSSFSQASNAHEVQQEEPEIRGTQV